LPQATSGLWLPPAGLAWQKSSRYQALSAGCSQRATGIFCSQGYFRPAQRDERDTVTVAGARLVFYTYGMHDIAEALGHEPFTQLDGSPVPQLVNEYSGRRAFLICGGPSFKRVDKDRILSSGLLTMTLNAGVKTYRSDLWLGVEEKIFDPSIWPDECVRKFVPASAVKLRHVKKARNTWLYRRNCNWYGERMFAHANTMDWENRRGNGYRTSMIDAIRVLYVLGVREINLLGVDFHQSRNYGYHHPTTGSRNTVSGNNRIYRALSRRFERLRPVMEAAGLFIYNCNRDSHLEAFEKRELPC
jgi:hypothetical protein